MAARDAEEDIDLQRTREEIRRVWGEIDRERERAQRDLETMRRRAEERIGLIPEEQARQLWARSDERMLLLAGRAILANNGRFGGLHLLASPAPSRQPVAPTEQKSASRTTLQALPSSPPQSGAGRRLGSRQFPDEQCDDLARQAIHLRSTPPVTRWREIENLLGVPKKTLERYIAALKEKEGQ